MSDNHGLNLDEILPEIPESYRERYLETFYSMLGIEEEKSKVKLEENQNVNTDGNRIVKFEILIKDIDNDLMTQVGKSYGTMKRLHENILSRSMQQEAQSGILSPLDMIFQRDRLNIYGQTIMRNSTILMPPSSGSFNSWYAKYRSENVNSEEIMYFAAKDFIIHLRECNDGYIQAIKYTKYTFTFWGLMVLSVDETDADEKLSLICDFAKMLQITDDELIDIANIIKLIYHDTNERYAFKSASTEYVFEKLVATQHLSVIFTEPEEAVEE